MREFNGYCISSNEYRQLYELEAQHSFELSKKVVQRDNVILALHNELESIKQELGSTKQELSAKNATVVELEAKVEHKDELTEERMKHLVLLKDPSNVEFPLEDRKGERASSSDSGIDSMVKVPSNTNIRELQDTKIESLLQDHAKIKHSMLDSNTLRMQQFCLLKVEEKVVELAKMANAMRDEVEKMGSEQIALNNQVQSYKQEIEDQRTVIEDQRSVIVDTEAVNHQLASKVENLTNLYREACARTKEDASVIQMQANKIVEQKRELGECNDFMTFIREREGELVARLGQLEEYYHMKRCNQSCMLFRGRRRKPKSAEKIVLGIGKLLVNEKFESQSSLNSCDGRCGQKLQW